MSPVPAPAVSRTGPPAGPPPRPAARRRADIEEMFTGERHLWLATAGPDGPHMIPLAFAWDGTDLVMMTKRGSRTVANLRRTARARAALGTARDVVLVDGPVSLREPAELPGRVRALFDRLPLNPDRVPGVIALCLRPERISAWRGLPEIPGRTVMSGGDWLG
ncbi:pyridoxamine 5'-phosphate oxidase family protein [Streptosporangium sandarakinum]|uniref:pyridoxamine 5'-phosphate oxidase family protein n=1 Tax=Streptosporangium TaxID=2000 RepID=UPI0031F7F951